MNAKEGINRPINLPLISGERRHDVRNFENDFICKIKNKKKKERKIKFENYFT